MKRANGEGSLYQRSDGRWAGSTVIVTAIGTRKRHTVYGRTRKEAHEKLTALLRATQQGLPAGYELWRLDAYLTHWLTEVARYKVRASTYHSYDIYIRNHLVPGLGARRLDRLSAADVRAFLNAKRETGLSPRTVQYLHAILRVALAQAVRDDLIGRNVAKLVNTPGAHRPEVRPLNPTEARQLLDHATQDRLYALYAVALAMGSVAGRPSG